METAMTTTLKGGVHASRAVDPTHLETLGKTAARMAESGELSLTDAVVHTIGREKLNSEQVRRVVEHANVEAFNRKFASTSGPMRAVQIDGGPADPVDVLQALNDAARPREVTIDALEYSMPPGIGKTSSYDTSLPFDRTVGGVTGDIYALQSQLQSAHDEVIQNFEASKEQMNESMVALAGAVKSASLQGAAPSEIYDSWVRRSPELAKLAFDRTRSFMRDSNVKVAGRSLNPAHPVVRHFEDFVKAAQSYNAHHQACASIEAELLKVSKWLSRNGRAA
jgi:hypothetical protein